MDKKPKSGDELRKELERKVPEAVKDELPSHTPDWVKESLNGERDVSPLNQAAKDELEEAVEKGEAKENEDGSYRYKSEG